MKGISKEDFPKNCLGELSNNSSRRQTHDCFGEISSNSPRKVVQCIYQNSVVSFREQKDFVLKTVILLPFGLGVCDGVGEDSGHGFGHVDIRVGSLNCLNVIVFHNICTYVGSNPGRKLSLLGFAHPVEGSPFQVQGAIGEATLTTGRLLEESRLVALILLHNMY